ncbi:hypothetical protein AMTR_s00086p00142210 [Amborella trichopoda]|uniref:Uncharacterized protein n=1 Tax=Amborella trichopoda TaxID=13333 RepID=W1P597_AMBTC|nr:hypothetical protein AMTR_s00086p00142210 [Amborella trichopoda]
METQSKPEAHSVGHWAIGKDQQERSLKEGRTSSNSIKPLTTRDPQNPIEDCLSLKLATQGCHNEQAISKGPPMTIESANPPEDTTAPTIEDLKAEYLSPPIFPIRGTVWSIPQVPQENLLEIIRGPPLSYIMDIPPNRDEYLTTTNYPQNPIQDCLSPRQARNKEQVISKRSTMTVENGDQLTDATALITKDLGIEELSPVISHTSGTILSTPQVPREDLKIIQGPSSPYITDDPPKWDEGLMKRPILRMDEPETFNVSNDNLIPQAVPPQ